MQVGSDDAEDEEELPSRVVGLPHRVIFERKNGDAAAITTPHVLFSTVLPHSPPTAPGHTAKLILHSRISSMHARRVAALASARGEEAEDIGLLNFGYSLDPADIPSSDDLNQGDSPWLNKWKQTRCCAGLGGGCSGLAVDRCPAGGCLIVTNKYIYLVSIKRNISLT